MEKSSPQSRWVGLIFLVLSLATTTAPVALWLLHVLSLPTALSLIVGGGIPTSYLTWVTLRRSEATRGGTLADVADLLAEKVDSQWDDEQRVRRLHNPYALPVSWEAADPDLVEDWSSLVSTAEDWPANSLLEPTTWAADPAGLAGSGNELGAALRRVPTGRLVVLGEPGAGKTMLLVRLISDLLTHRVPGGPVPVLISLTSWIPAEEEGVGEEVAEEEGLYDWLAGRLAIEYPVLAEPALAPAGKDSRAKALLNKGLILPILDGLDEIPKAVRDRALDRINDWLLDGQGLVVSSQTNAYRETVHPPGRQSVKLSPDISLADRAPTVQEPAELPGPN